MFLLLWWWCLVVAFIGFLRLIWRAAQCRCGEVLNRWWSSHYLHCRSSWLRFHMIHMRMNRYFKRSTKMDKIRAFIDECKLGDWFVLYQMSKNLNRPFFMDFLTQLSVRYSLRWLLFNLRSSLTSTHISDLMSRTQTATRETIWWQCSSSPATPLRLEIKHHTHLSRFSLSRPFQDSTKSNGSDKVLDSKSEISSLIRAASAKQH